MARLTQLGDQIDLLQKSQNTTSAQMETLRKDRSAALYNLMDSLETACLLKELGAKWVVSRAERDVQEKFLLRNGADQVVYPEKQMAKWTAIRYSSDHVFDYIEIDSQYAIFEVEIPENWIGKNVGQLDIRKKYGINILATRKYGKTDVAVSPETVLNGDATILVLGEYKAIQKCFRI